MTVLSPANAYIKRKGKANGGRRMKRKNYGRLYDIWVLVSYSLANNLDGKVVSLVFPLGKMAFMSSCIRYHKREERV